MITWVVFISISLAQSGSTTTPRSMGSLSLWDLLYFEDDAWRHHIPDKADASLLNTWTSNLDSMRELLRAIAVDDEAVYKGQIPKMLGSIHLDNTLSETPLPGVTYRLFREFKKRFNNRVFRGECSDCSHREVIVKYQTNCDAIVRNEHCRNSNLNDFCPLLRDEDPLVKEFVISKIFQSTGICPAVLILSSPESLLVPGISAGKKLHKLNFKMLKNEKWRDLCLHQKYPIAPTVRMIVEEKMGKNIMQYYREDLVGNFGKLTVPKLIDSVVLFIRIIQAIQIFHDYGFVHGDIHAGNIVVRKNKREYKSDWDVVLIDFGYSKFFPVEFGTPEMIETDVYKDLNPALLSSFQIRGYRVGRRDDVFRAFEILVNFLTNFTYLSHASRRKIRDNIYEDDWPESYRGTEGFLRTAMLNSNKPFFRHDFHEIEKLLGYMLEYVRGDYDGPLSHPDARPDYEWIIDCARAIIDHLRPYSV